MVLSFFYGQNGYKVAKCECQKRLKIALFVLLLSRSCTRKHVRARSCTNTHEITRSYTLHSLRQVLLLTPLVLPLVSAQCFSGSPIVTLWFSVVLPLAHSHIALFLLPILVARWSGGVPSRNSAVPGIPPGVQPPIIAQNMCFVQ